MATRERVSRSSPFQFVGLDYLGPIYVKGESEMKKVWVCLFTCLTVRAVHLEWVTDLTAVQFLSCMRRFVSRRGKPDLIISDNAPQFKLVNTALNKQWRQMFIDREVLNYVAMEGIKWSYTTALAPWQGGFYERLVGMVKRSLRKAVGRKHFTLEQLVTLLVEIEAVLNSRPLTYVYEDFESGFILTPAHFLVINRKLGLSTGNDDDYHQDDDFQPGKDSTAKLLESWRKGQIYLDLFWKVWRDEYLLSLREKLPIYHKSSTEIQRVPKEGDIVLVKDDNLPRSSWKLGRILHLVHGQDEKVRSAKILLPGHTVVSRAINCLYTLELPTCKEEQKISAEHCNDLKIPHEDMSEETSGKQDNNQNIDKKQRKASQIARQAIFKSLNDNGAILFLSPGNVME